MKIEDKEKYAKQVRHRIMGRITTVRSYSDLESLIENEVAEMLKHIEDDF